MGMELAIAIVGAVGLVLAAFVTGVISFLSGRKKAKAELQVSKATIEVAVSESFQRLVDELQEERKELTAALDRCDDRIQKQSTKIDTLERAVRSMVRHIERLEVELEKHGLPVPPMPALSMPAA